MTVNSRGVRIVGMISVGVVAIVAAVVSYAHMQTVAERAGEGWRSWLEPLSVDGLLVGASLVLYVRRSSRFAWLAVSMGILVSLAANLAAAHPTLVSRLVSAWPAVALALSYETLLTLVRRTPDDHQHDNVEPIHANVVREQSTPDMEPVPQLEPASHDTTDAGDLLDQARQLVAQARDDGQPMGRTRLARQLGVSDTVARRLLTRITRENKPHLVHDTQSTLDIPEQDNTAPVNDPYAWLREASK